MNAFVGDLTHRRTVADDEFMVCALRLRQRCKRATHHASSRVMPLALNIAFRFATCIASRQSTKIHLSSSVALSLTCDDTVVRRSAVSNVRKAIALARVGAAGQKGQQLNSLYCWMCSVYEGQYVLVWPCSEYPETSEEFDDRALEFP
jgi:hypothetical protein